MWFDIAIKLAPNTGLDRMALRAIKEQLADLSPEQIREAKSLADAWCAEHRAPYDEMQKRRAEREKVAGVGPQIR